MNQRRNDLSFQDGGDAAGVTGECRDCHAFPIFWKRE